MADSTIDSELIQLYDVWPGPVEPASGVPGHGLLDKRYQNVAAPYVPIGTKIQLQNLDATGQPGPTILLYLQVGTQDTGTAIAAKMVCVPDSATLWYQLTNDGDSLIKIPTKLGCIALSAITNAYYGWFWAGGVAPETFVPAMGGNYVTDGLVVAGDFIAHDMTDDHIGLGKASGVNEPAMGFALAADA